MDPFLEISGDWRDFHVRFLNNACDSIAERLPGHYIARLEEQFRVLEVPTERWRRRLPDVAVVRTGPAARPGTAANQAAVATLDTLEPKTLPLVAEVEEIEVRDSWIEIRSRPGWTLVTAIELLSPTNKAHPGRSDYLAKRRALFEEPVNLVEIDLLLNSSRLPLGEELPAGDYYALVARAERRPYCDVYAWSIRRKLPAVPIPLKPPDPDVPLDLAAVCATAYDRGRYALSIDYSAPLDLPLAAEDRAWAEELARTTQG
jgi:hypothetical protein